MLVDTLRRIGPVAGHLRRFASTGFCARIGAPILFATCLLAPLYPSRLSLADESAPKYRPAIPHGMTQVPKRAGGPDEDLRVFEPATVFGALTPAAALVSPGTTVGETYYDYQHNSSTGRQVGKFGDNIQVTYMRQALPQLSPGRKVNWNRVGVAGSPTSQTLDNGGLIRRLPLGAPATPLGVAVGPEDQQGYTNLSLLPNGRAAAFYHAIGALGSWAVAMDSAADQGRFKNPDYKYTAPTAPVTDAAVWPHGIMDVVGTDTVLHCVATEGNASGYQRLYYWRGILGHPGGVAVSMTWSTPLLVDNVTTISAVVEADPTSDRVAIVYTRPRDLSNDFDNDVAYCLSTDGGLSWGLPVNITNYTSASEQRAYADVGALFDQNGTLHIAYNTTRWRYSEYTSYLPVVLWHWNSVRATSRMITAAYWTNTCSDNYYQYGAGWSLQLAKPTLSVKPAGAGPGGGLPDEVLYVTWVQFGPTQTDCATQGDGVTPGGLVNSEIWWSGSSDDGLSWDMPQNVTGTETPNCALGACHSEQWVTAAALADSGVYLSYVDDTHAGGISQNEGGWSLSPYKVLALEARTPVVSPRLVVLPVEPAEWNTPYWGNRIILTAPPAGATTDKISVSNPGNAQLNFTATIVNNGPASSNPLVNGVAVYNGSIPVGGSTETLTVSYDPTAGGYMDFEVQIGSNAPARPMGVDSGPFTVYWKAGVPDDRYWQPLGAGLNGTVFALIEYNGKLIAGGGFTTAGGNPANHIAAWDGLNWTPLSSGVDNTVFALAVHNGKLYAGGLFLNAGGTSASNIAAWDGNTWSAVGAGMSGGVRALAVYHNELIAGGSFTVNLDGIYRIARWDGTAWRRLSDLGSYAVYALAVYNDKLYAGGDFEVNGTSNHPANDIASWDSASNSWLPLGPGLFANLSSVRALTAYQNKLIVGGTYYGALGNGLDLASWDGTAWSGPLGRFSVYALAVHNSALKVSYSGTEYMESWDGASWSPMGSGTNAVARAWTLYNGQLIAGGDFSVAGNRQCLHIAAWTQGLSCPITVTGDVNISGSITSADVITLVNYVFKSGSPPKPCVAAGDVNCNGSVTSADVISLVNFVFKSGAPPCDGCTSALAAGC